MARALVLGAINYKRPFTERDTRHRRRRCRRSDTQAHYYIDSHYFADIVTS